MDFTDLNQSYAGACRAVESYARGLDAMVAEARACAGRHHPLAEDITPEVEGETCTMPAVARIVYADGQADDR